ncbi:PAS domain-containing sensor histidine kinase [Archangium violaceum]|uniref:sensor histidine kinase n=1 Tax=Archangium violaceum TaxID=83451 RepID=UPI000697BD12|nr:PAS domain-containing sensor histidine kinase [Archangium violaceum]
MTTSPHRASLRRLKQGLAPLAPAVSGLAVLVASFNLLGWALGSRPLTRLIPVQGAISMMPNTAIGFILSGLALWLLHPEGPDRRRRTTGQALALVTLLLGGLTLAEYLFGLDAGIDLLLFGGTVQRMVPLSPGRPSPMTAMNFCLLGGALLLLHVRTRQGRLPARFLALTVTLLSAQVLIGYMYLEESLFGPRRLFSFLPPFTPMAVHTAALFLLLSLGILSVHPERGLTGLLLRDDVGGILVRRLLPAVLLTPLLVGGMWLLGERLGLFGTTLGVSLFVLATMVAFLFVLARNASTLSRLDAQRHAMEQSLRLSEARFAGIVSTAADAILSIDEAQRITLFNTGAEHIFGYPANEVLGRPLNLLLPERFQAIHRQHIREFAASGQTARHMGERRTIIGRRKNGDEFPAEASISKLRVDGTELLTVIVRDITARQRAEEGLRNSEERFRTSFEDAPIGMALVGLDGRFLNVNGSLCGIVGYSHKELITKTFQDITWPEDLELHLANAHRLLQGEISSYQMEKRYIHKDGHRVTILLTGSLVRGARGEPLHYIEQLQDISERKQLEQAWRFLAEAGPRLAASLDAQTTLTTVAGLAVPALADWSLVEQLDEEGRVKRVEGLADSPEKSRLLRELLTTQPRRPSNPRHLLAHVLRTGQPALLPEFSEAVLEAAAEDSHHLELLHRLEPRSGLVVPLVTRGRNLGTLLLVMSESGRRYEARDLALAEELAQRAALAIDNACLHEKSEQATHTRDEVLRIVAHDLRTPLNVISLSTKVLLKHPPEKRATDTKPLEAIQKAVDRATRLILDLLDIARMEAGRLSVDRGPEQTAPLVREAAELHRALAEEKSIQLMVSVPEDAPPVFADRDRVLQILSNLLGNALKFTPMGGRILLRAEPAGSLVRFSVSDTGSGIPEEDLPHLFEPFWQASAGRKQGAGLGLAIVKGLVDAHGGHLRVESSPGVGSTFFFTLPTASPAEVHPRPHA